MIQLVVVEGPDAGSRFTLGEAPIIIGRGKTCAIVIQDETLSRHHCTIYRDAGRLFLRDLSSANGTFLNTLENQIDYHALDHGDEILIGNTRIRVEWPETEKNPPPEALRPSSIDSSIDSNRSAETLQPETTLPFSSPPLPSSAAPALPETSPLTTPRIHIAVISGPDRGQEFSPEGASFSIGREKTCDIVLHDQGASRLHATIKQQAGTYRVCDEQSRWGTFLRTPGNRVSYAELSSGDIIYVGQSQLRVTLPSSVPDPEVPLPQAEDVTRAVPPGRVLPLDEEATRAVSIPFQSQPSISLRIVVGEDAGTVFTSPPGTQRFTVGRSQAADFRLQDTQVSRIHFAVERSPTGFILRDEQSLNGTFLNNDTTPVNQQPLRGGETIRVCDTQLAVEVVWPQKEGGGPIPPGQQASSALPLEVTFPPRWSSLFMAFLVTASAYGFLQFDKTTFYASEPVSAVHANLEEECATCHVPWRGPSAATCGTPGCHAGILQASEQVQDECLDCHTEHRGRAFDIKGQDTLCWGCHETDFLERPLWAPYKEIVVAKNSPREDSLGSALHLPLPTNVRERQAWQQNAPRMATGLRFSHTAHQRDAKELTVCESCHYALPGKIINALGTISAFPTHAECITCHPEVGAVSPQVARAKASPACLKCHTQQDGTITRVQRTISYVRFSHDPHADTRCITCHFSIENEGRYAPMSRSTAPYLLPMPACVSCHEQTGATTACLACHPAHHRFVSTQQQMTH